jgi:peptidoglycan/LPS O-acetylase OafA/YrhL
VKEPAIPRNLEIERLRGIAILYVFLFHSGIQFAVRGCEVINYMATGVDIFFVISGYLIVGNLWRRMPQATMCAWGQVKAFYLRRIFRILPLAILFTVLSIGLRHYHWSELVYMFTFTINFAVMFIPGLALGYLWSLSVEEQFYLVVPWFILLCGSWRRVRFWIPILFVFILSVQLAMIFGQKNSAVWFHSRYQGLFLGAYLALAQDQLKLPVWFYAGQGVAPKILAYFCLFLLAGIPLFIDGGHIMAIHCFLASFFSAVLVWMATFRQGFVLDIPVLSRILEYLGSRSYGVFLIHVAANIWVAEQAPGLRLLPKPVQIVIALIISIALSDLAYRYYEWPLRQLGYRLARGSEVFPARA